MSHDHLAVTPATWSGRGFLHFWSWVSFARDVCEPHAPTIKETPHVTRFWGMFFRWYVFWGPQNPASFRQLRRSRPGLSAKGTWHCIEIGHRFWHKLGGLKQDLWDLAKHPFHLGSFPIFPMELGLETNYSTQEFPVFFFKWRFWATGFHTRNTIILVVTFGKTPGIPRMCSALWRPYPTVGILGLFSGKDSGSHIFWCFL